MDIQGFIKEMQDVTARAKDVPYSKVLDLGSYSDLYSMNTFLSIPCSCRGNYSVTHFVMSVKTWKGFYANERNSFDMETTKWKLEAGCFGHLGDIMIVVSNDVPEDSIIVLSENAEKHIRTEHLQYAVKNTPIGRAYFVQEEDGLPDLPEGQTWILMRIGMGMSLDSSEKGRKHLKEKVLIPFYELCATDRRSAQEAISEKVGQLFDAFEKEGKI